MEGIFKVLGALRDGGAERDYTRELERVTRAVQETGKPGLLTIQVKVEPKGGERVRISDKLVAKCPELPADAATFYITGDGGLSRSAPNQPELPTLRIEKGGA